MKKNGNNNTAITIKELAEQLQYKIDIYMEHFMADHILMQSLHAKIEELEKRMSVIVQELEPVQSLIYTQHPRLEKIFESLKRIYGKDENGNSIIDTETE